MQVNFDRMIKSSTEMSVNGTFDSLSLLSIASIAAGSKSHTPVFVTASDQQQSSKTTKRNRHNNNNSNHVEHGRGAMIGRLPIIVQENDVLETKAYDSADDAVVLEPKHMIDKINDCTNSTNKSFIDILMANVRTAVEQQQTSNTHTRKTTKKSLPLSSKKKSISCLDDSLVVLQVRDNEDTIRIDPNRNPKIITYRHPSNGKLYKFVAPKETIITHQAAIHIERMIRGWYQRMQYRIMYIQYQIDIVLPQQTQRELEQIRIQKEYQMKRERSKFLKQQQTEQGHVQRKHHYPSTSSNKKKQQNQDEIRRLALLDESRQIIDYLRNENRHIRIENEQLYKEMETLQQENEQLQKIQNEMKYHFHCLQENYQQVQETHDQLQEAIKYYETHIHPMEGAIEIRQFYEQSEQKTKLLYINQLMKILYQMEQNCTDVTLFDQVVDLFFHNEKEG